MSECTILQKWNAFTNRNGAQQEQTHASFKCTSALLRDTITVAFAWSTLPHTLLFLCIRTQYLGWTPEGRPGLHGFINMWIENKRNILWVDVWSELVLRMSAGTRGKLTGCRDRWHGDMSYVLKPASGLYKPRRGRGPQLAWDQLRQTLCQRESLIKLTFSDTNIAQQL